MYRNRLYNSLCVHCACIHSEECMKFFRSILKLIFFTFAKRHPIKVLSLPSFFGNLTEKTHSRVTMHIFCLIQNNIQNHNYTFVCIIHTFVYFYNFILGICSITVQTCFVISCCFGVFFPCLKLK